MCIIAVCKNKIPKDTFKNCFDSNDDGFGMAWVNDKVNFVKGIMDYDEAWDLYDKSIFKNKIGKSDFTHVLHFRVGTPVCKELTHPFLITEDSKETYNYSGKDSILFHNGTITGWRDHLMPYFLKIDYIPDGKISDTRLYAMLLSKLGDNLMNYIDGRFVIIKPNSIELYGKFEENNGNMFSNESYKTRRFNSYKSDNTQLAFKSYNEVLQEFII